jgi:hypothetical protein
MYHIFFIHPSTDGHLGCLQFSAIVNNATMNTGVQRCPQRTDFISFDYIPSSKTVVSYGSSRGTFILFSIMAVLIYFPTICTEGFFFFPHLIDFTGSHLL